MPFLLPCCPTYFGGNWALLCKYIEMASQSAQLSIYLNAADDVSLHQCNAFLG